MEIEEFTRRQVAYLMKVLTLVVPFGVFWQGARSGNVETAIYSFPVIKSHRGGGGSTLGIQRIQKIFGSSHSPNISLQISTISPIVAYAFTALTT